MTVTDLPRALLREDLANSSGWDVRAAARSGQWRRATHGLARGYVQANMAIVPKRYAFDFMLFCQRNPKPCPVIDVTDPGDPEARFAAPGSDVRIDLPGYRVFRDGKLVAEVSEITNYWRADSVAFLLGCSNSMDDVLIEARIPQRHLESEDGRISVYASNIMCAPAGIFRGPVVVTMRRKVAWSTRSRSRRAIRWRTARRCTWVIRARSVSKISAALAGENTTNSVTMMSRYSGPAA
jgi:uncharacterized protein YcsI (UPF0317 family)